MSESTELKTYNEWNEEGRYIIKGSKNKGFKDGKALFSKSQTEPKKKQLTEYQKRVIEVNSRNTTMNPLSAAIFDIGDKHGVYDDIYDDMMGMDFDCDY